MKRIRISILFLGATFWIFFINFTGWDSIGFIYPFWIAFIGLRMLEKNKNKQLFLINKKLINDYSLLVFWVCYNIIIAFLHASENQALKLGFFYSLGAAMLFILIDANLSLKELNYLFNMYTGVAVATAALMLFQRVNVSGYINRYTVEILGTAKDPNFLGAYLLLPCIYCFYQFAFKKVRPLFFAVLAGILSVEILFTGSRSTFLTLCLGFMVVSFFGISHKNFAYKFFFVSAIILIGGILILPDDIWLRLIDLESYNDGSNRLRLAAWVTAKNIWLDNFFFGAGHNSVYNYSKAFGMSLKMFTHSAFLDILAELGIVGFIIFISMPLKIGIKALKQKNILALGILVVTMAASAIISSQYSQFFWINFAICGVLLQTNNTTNNANMKEAK